MCWPAYVIMVVADTQGQIDIRPLSNANLTWLQLDCHNHIMQLTYYSDVIMGAMASQITSLTIAYWTICSYSDQRKQQSSVSLAFVREFPAQMASYAENVSIWWCHHVLHVNPSGAETINIPAEISQYHGCWCLGDASSQVIFNQNTDYTKEMGPCPAQGVIWTTCAIISLSI